MQSADFDLKVYQCLIGILQTGKTCRKHHISVAAIAIAKIVSSDQSLKRTEIEDKLAQDYNNIPTSFSHILSGTRLVEKLVGGSTQELKDLQYFFKPLGATESEVKPRKAAVNTAYYLYEVQQTT